MRSYPRNRIPGDTRTVDNSGAIGDFIWYDADGDGMKDDAEAGMAGVTLRLYEDADNNGVLSAGDVLLTTTATDDNGLYQFTGLPDDQNVVVVDSGTLPANVTQTYDPNEAAPCSTCDGQSAANVIGGGEIDTIDFAYKPTGVIDSPNPY